MATLVTLEANVGKPLGLDYTGTDKTELDVKLNDAVVNMLRRTRCYQTTGTMTVTAGTSDYTLDTSILSLSKLYTTASGTAYELDQVTVDELIDLRMLNSNSSSPLFRYALAGASTLLLYPPPSAADTLNSLYVPRPTAMSAAGNDPSTATYGGIPAEWHHGLELYALWKMADSTDDSTSGQGERYRIQYEGDDGRGGVLAQIRAEMHRKGGRLARARAPRGRRRLPHFNDQYWG